MGKKKAARQVERAFADGSLVRIVRQKGWEQLNACVVGVGKTWLLLATEVDAGFYGHAFVRRSDVRRVDDVMGAGFVELALASEGDWPMRKVDDVDLSSAAAVLASAARVAPLVAVHYEQEHPDECLIGVPVDLRRRRFRLRTVTPGADWEAEDTVLRYGAVSRVDVGGVYVRRLARVAGSMPTGD